jgi:DNA-binding XRE family transcriptional regulator
MRLAIRSRMTHIWAMDRQQFVKRLRAADTTQSQMARDLGIHPTTVLRWRDSGVPKYALAYLLAVEAMGDDERAEYRVKLMETPNG